MLAAQRETGRTLAPERETRLTLAARIVATLGS